MLVLPSLRRRGLLASLIRPPVLSLGRYGMSVGASGANSHIQPATEGTHYKWPSDAELDLAVTYKLGHVRLPVSWEHAQVALNGALDAGYMDGYMAAVERCRQRRLPVMVDFHTYLHRWVGGVEKLIGGSGSGVTVAHYNDFLTKFMTRAVQNPAVVLCEPVNEPKNVNDGGVNLATVMQSLINAIATVAPNVLLLIHNDSYSSARFYKDQANLAAFAALTHPSGKARLRYIAHQYNDRKNVLSGRYSPTSFDLQGEPTGAGMDPNPDYSGTEICGPVAVGSYAVKFDPFFEFLTQYDLLGGVTEIGVPDGDPRWASELELVVAKLAANPRIEIITGWWMSDYAGPDYAVQLYRRPDGYDRLTAKPFTDRTGGVFNPPPASTASYRVTESGERRITESGDFRILESA